MADESPGPARQPVGRVSDRFTMYPKRWLLLGLVCFVPMLPYAPGLALWISSREAVIQVSSLSVDEWTTHKGAPMLRVRITREAGGETTACRLHLFQGNDIPKAQGPSLDILRKPQPVSVQGRVGSLGSGTCWVYTDISTLAPPLLACLLIFAATWRFSSAEGTRKP